MLKPGGLLCAADRGKSVNLLMHILFWLVQIFDDFSRMRGNAAGLPG